MNRILIVVSLIHLIVCAAAFSFHSSPVLSGVFFMALLMTGAVGKLIFDRFIDSRNADPIRETFTSYLEGGSKLGFLKTIRYFCARSDRDIVDVTIRDLRLDIKEMKNESRSKIFVNTVVAWRSASVVAMMVWSTLIKPLTRVRKLFRG